MQWDFVHETKFQTNAQICMLTIDVSELYPQLTFSNNQLWVGLIADGGDDDNDASTINQFRRCRRVTGVRRSLAGSSEEARVAQAIRGELPLGRPVSARRHDRTQVLVAQAVQGKLP